MKIHVIGLHNQFIGELVRKLSEWAEVKYFDFPRDGIAADDVDVFVLEHLHTPKMEGWHPDELVNVIQDQHPTATLVLFDRSHPWPSVRAVWPRAEGIGQHRVVEIGDTLWEILRSAKSTA